MTGPDELDAVLAQRRATIRRTTRETQVTVAVNLDATEQEYVDSDISTGVPMLDHLLSAFARHGHMGLSAQARGDVHVDDHHTVEDVGIVLGEAVYQALGARRGIVRFGYAYAPMDEALARAVVDISGRGCIVYALNDVRLPERVGTFDSSLAEEFWIAFVANAKLALHLDLLRARNGHHALESLFKAAGLAMRMATRIDSPGGAVPSTKGVLG